MKILMIPTWYSARDAEVMSAGIFHYEQSMALKKYAETAVYFPYDMNFDGGFCQGEEHGLLTFRRGKRLAFLRPIYYVLDYLKICKTFKPDVIHGHVALAAGLPAVLLGKLFKVPVVITEHNPMEMMGFEDPSRVDFARKMYKGSDANICVSRNQMERLQEYFPEEQFQVIHNGVYDPETIERDGNQYAVEGNINACIVAAFYSKEIKGYQFLIPAMKELVASGMDITLHICGGGDYLSYYQDMAKELGVEKNCIFYDQCDKKKMYSIMSQMDFTISASLFESAGVAVQESQLLGKPVVVTKSGGANSLVTEDTAIVVEKGSVDALVDGIKEMSGALSTFDSAKIRKYALSQFEIDEVSQKYMEVYTSILKK